MKIIAAIILFALSLNLSGQTSEPSKNPVNKNGVEIMPKQGDWSLGISAQPFLEYAGNLLTSSFNPSPVFTSGNPGSIYAKYCISSTTSIRGNLSIGISSRTDKSPNSFDPDLYDKQIQSALAIGIGAGLEKYKTIRGRLRGFYGAELGIDKHPNDGPYFGKYAYKDADNKANDYKIIGGNTITIYTQGFIGIEYFFAPQMSVSGELGLGAYFAKTGIRKSVDSDDEETVTDAGGSSFGIQTQTTGLINLFFYF
jgi:hypothetical protein